MERVSKSGAKFDPNKTTWFQQHYLREQANEVLATELRMLFPSLTQSNQELAIICGLMKERATFVQDIHIDGHYLFERPSEIDQESISKKWKDNTSSLLLGWKSKLSQLEAFDASTIEKEFKSYLEENAVGIGAVLLPFRIGNDINHPGYKSEAEPYTNITYGKTLGTIENDQVEKGLIRFARAVSQNYYIHKNIAIVDPDAFFVSPQYTINEAKCHMTLEAIMGGLFFNGDKVESLPAERLELLKNKDIIAVNKLGVHAIPLDLFSGVDIPTIWKLETKDRLIITVFNWLDNDVTKTYNLKTDFELSSSKYKLTEIWTKGNFSIVSDKLTLSQPAHSVKIIEFQKL